jgi:hypothetical protein
MLTHTNEINHAINEPDWIQSESIRMLMQTRFSTNIFIGASMLIVAGQMYGHIKLELILLWLFSAFSILILIFFYKKAFAKRMNAASIAQKVIFIERSRQVWSLNAFIWGLLAWLFFAKLPIQNQFVCAVILRS